MHAQGWLRVALKLIAAAKRVESLNRSLQCGAPTTNLGKHNVHLAQVLGVRAHDAAVPGQLAHASVVQLTHHLARTEVTVALGTGVTGGGKQTTTTPDTHPAQSTKPTGLRWQTAGRYRCTSTRWKKYKRPQQTTSAPRCVHPAACTYIKHLLQVSGAVVGRGRCRGTVAHTTGTGRLHTLALQAEPVTMGTCSGPPSQPRQHNGDSRCDSRPRYKAYSHRRGTGTSNNTAPHLCTALRL